MASDTLDFSLSRGTAEEIQQFGVLLLQGIKERGYVKIQNSDISAHEISEVFNYSRQFFDLPLSEKLKIQHPPAAMPNRGYSFFGQENLGNEGDESGGTVVKDISDLKEALDFGSPADHFMENMWLEDSAVPGFQATVEDFFRRCQRIETDLFLALSQALGLPASRLTETHSRAENELRLLHYPSLPAADSPHQRRVTRIAPHTDWGTMTMLWQDSCGGLAVQNRSGPDGSGNGDFQPVDSAPAEFILSIGDSLQRMTNDTLLATPHQVNFPEPVEQDGEQVLLERYSVAYFIKPNRDTSLLPLEEFVSADRPCRAKVEYYPPHPILTIAGYVTDSLRTRRGPFLVGLVTLAIGTALLCVGTSLALWIVGRILQGMPTVVVWSTGLALLIDVAPKDELGRLTGYIGTVPSLRTFGGPVIGGLLYQYAGYYAVFAVAFALIALDAVLRLAVAERPGGGCASPRTESELEAPDDAHVGSKGRAGDKLRLPVATLTPMPSPLTSTRFARPAVFTFLCSPRLLVALYGYFILSVLFSAFDTVLPLFVSDTFGWTRLGQGLVFIPLSVPQLLSPVAGALMDRFPASRRYVVAGLFLASTPILVSLRFVTAATIPHQVLLCALLTLLGMVVAVAIPAVMTEIGLVVTDQVGDSRGATAQAYGLGHTVLGLGTITGSLLAGYLRDLHRWAVMAAMVEKGKPGVPKKPELSPHFFILASSRISATIERCDLLVGKFSLLASHTQHFNPPSGPTAAMLKPTRTVWSVQLHGLQPSSRGLARPPPLSAYRQGTRLMSIAQSKMTLASSLSQYRLATESVESWLVNTARAYGYQIDPLTANANSTDDNNDNNDNNNDDNNQTSQALSKEARKLAHDEKAFAAASPPVSGAAPPSKQQSVYTNKIDKIGHREFIRLADFIAASDPPVSVPATFIEALDRAISIRLAHGKQVIGKIPNGPYKRSMVQQHNYFIRVLKHVREVLCPKVSSVREPGERQDETAIHLSYEGELRQNLEEAYLGFELLKKDFRSLRAVIIRSWLGYRQGMFDLVTVSLLTNSAIGTARRRQEEVQKLFDKHGGSARMLNAIYAAQCTLHGEMPNFREQPGDDLNFRMYDVADSMMLPAFMLLQSFDQDALVKPRNNPPYKPDYGMFNPASARSEKSAREKFQEDKIVMLDMLSGFSTFHQRVPPQPFEDEFTRGLRLMLKTHIIPIWLVFAAQVFLDIHHALRGNVTRAISDLQVSVGSMEACIKKKLEFHSSLTVAGWPKKSYQAFHSMLKEIHWWVDSDHRWVDSDPVVHPEAKIKVRPREMFKFMKWNPLFCGMLNYNLQRGYKELSLSLPAVKSELLMVAGGAVDEIIEKREGNTVLESLRERECPVVFGVEERA
ncbi:uncharacterized protein KD926_010117 [Aspergillus affinis]|uniref:uncharacterized protein n=1 Tax=Aspergillus affinis TaxID=1070780 RepID=UPI0022FEFF1D|nr:uncharacterized protein KD926_010117 [Aspergillus affinis]KAI9038903.1 hypothetical protein KD926_010117 [Aspergillus affinis]